MNKIISILLALVLCGVVQSVLAQQKPAQWNLKNCIEYAHANNIKVQKARIAVNESNVDLKEAKAAYLPSLSAEASQNLTNVNKSSSLNGRYSLSSSMTLFNGGKTANDVKQKTLQTRLQELSLKETENDIEVAITQAFLQLLYANETVKIDEQTLETSSAQLSRSKNLLSAGSITRIDYAQVEAQYSSDKYQLAVDMNTLDETRLSLKQLLELGVNDDFDVIMPSIF